MNEPMSRERIAEIREQYKNCTTQKTRVMLGWDELQVLLSTAERVEELESEVAKVNGFRERLQGKHHQLRDVANEYRAAIDQLRTTLANVTRERDELQLMFYYLVRQIWETRWVCEEEDYQTMVGTAAEIRSGNFDGIRAAMEKESK